MIHPCPALNIFHQWQNKYLPLKAGKGNLKLEEISVKQLIEYGLVETTEQVREKDIKIDLGQTEQLTIKADFELLINCFVSIMDHAIQHTGPV